MRDRVKVQIRGVVFTSEAIEASEKSGGEQIRGLRADFLTFIQRIREKGLLCALIDQNSEPALYDNARETGRLFDTIASMEQGRVEILRKCQRQLGAGAEQLLLIEKAPGAGAGSAIQIDLAATDGLPFLPFTASSYSDIDTDCLDGYVRQNLSYDPWKITQAVLDPQRSGYWETLFALSNGYMGIRGAHEESSGHLDYPAFYINGVFGYRYFHHELSYPGYPKRLQACLNLFDWRCIDLTVGSESFTLDQGRIHEFRRTLDLSQGVLRRRLTWESPGGSIVRIQSERLVSMKRRHVGAIRYSVTSVNFSGPLTLHSRILPLNRNLHFDTPRARLERSESEAGHCLATLVTEESGFRITLSARHLVECGEKYVLENSSSPEVLSSTARILATPGSSVTLTKYLACLTSLETGQRSLVAKAATESEEAASSGFDRLVEEQRRFWKRYWSRCDITVKGSRQDQIALRFALFHLRQSYREDGTRSISPNGLTGDLYMGNVFWDTEIFMLPFFLFSAPSLARTLLLYRYGLLDRARRRAAEMGGPGALYSWQSISGEECAIVPEASTAQYHLNSDIAYTIWKYVRCTGDTGFLWDAGAEIVFETARFLHHLGARIPLRQNRFCLNVVCGPDEYACGVDNNCYTNLMAQFHFYYAEEVHRQMSAACPEALEKLAERLQLKPAEVAAWREAAEQMYIPFVEELQIHAQDDSYLYRNPVDMRSIPRHRDIRWDHHPLNLWRLQLSKQADVVLLMYLLGDRFPLEVKKNNYDFYEPRTNHGSSLSTGIHAVLAAEIGYGDRAYDYFQESAWLDLSDLKGNTSRGIHAGCLGATWQAVVNGFGGLRIHAEGLQLRPRLPAAWQEYSFQILYQGCRLRVTVAPAIVEYELLEGHGICFSSWEEVLSLNRDCRRIVQELPKR